MIADLGLSKQLTIEVTSNPIIYGMPAYVESKCYKNDNYVRDKKSDIYSLGVLLWEITSGYPPFSKIPAYALSYKIGNGFREQPIIDTPLAYVNLYQKCWDDDPNLRPNIDEVFEILEKTLQIKNDENDPITVDLNRLNFINERSTDQINQNNLQSQSSSITTNNMNEFTLS